jgi:hypothetical protein
MHGQFSFSLVEIERAQFRRNLDPRHAKRFGKRDAIEGFQTRSYAFRLPRPIFMRVAQTGIPTVEAS